MKNTILAGFTVAMLTAGCSGLDLASAFAPTVTNQVAAEELLGISAVETNDAVLVPGSGATATNSPSATSVDLDVGICAVNLAGANSWRYASHCGDFVTLEEKLPQLSTDEFFGTRRELAAIGLDLDVRPTLTVGFNVDELEAETGVRSLPHRVYVRDFGLVMRFRKPLYDDVFAYTRTGTQGWSDGEFWSGTNFGDPDINPDPDYPELEFKTYTATESIASTVRIDALQDKTLDDLRQILTLNGETEVSVAPWMAITIYPGDIRAQDPLGNYAPKLRFSITAGEADVITRAITSD